MASTHITSPAVAPGQPPVVPPTPPTPAESKPMLRSDFFVRLVYEIIPITLIVAYTINALKIVRCIVYWKADHFKSLPKDIFSLIVLPLLYLRVFVNIYGVFHPCKPATASWSALEKALLFLCPTLADPIFATSPQGLAPVAVAEQ